jgi:hypothetical protein
MKRLAVLMAVLLVLTMATVAAAGPNDPWPGGDRITASGKGTK